MLNINFSRFFGSANDRKIKAKARTVEAINALEPQIKALSDDAGGRLLIRPYEPRRWPLQRTKGEQFRKRRKKRVGR